MTGASFNLDTAALLAKFAFTAYKEAETFKSTMGEDGFGTVFPETDSKTDTESYVSRHDERADIVVAFRGTEVGWKDILTDARLLASGLSYSYGFRGLLGRVFRLKRVHSGFLMAYRGVRAKVRRIVLELLSDEGDSHIYVTGHSLGGALATLCALDLWHLLNEEGIVGVPITMYNFGSPRVGTPRFVTSYNKKVTDSWRIVNDVDIVTTVPPRLGFFRHWLGYRHVSHFMFMTNEGNFDATRTDREELKPEHLNDMVHLLASAFNHEALDDHKMQHYREKLEAMVTSEPPVS